MHINNEGTSEASVPLQKSTILSCMALFYNFTGFRFLLQVTIYDPLSLDTGTFSLDDILE